MFSKEIPFDSAIKLSFYDNDGKKVNGLSIEQAIKVWQLNNNTLFYFKTGDGTEQELTIEQVKDLPNKKNILPSESNCNTGPVKCGPPLVRFFGGEGFGAAANAIISPLSSSVIGFDIVNRGKKYKRPPNAELIDPCGNGSGSSIIVTIDENETSPDYGKILDMVVIAPGDGYLTSPDGSLGGNERVWKEADEGYAVTPEGGYCVVQPYRPITLPSGSIYYSPSEAPRVLEKKETILLTLEPIKQTDEEDLIGPTNIRGGLGKENRLGIKGSGPGESAGNPTVNVGSTYPVYLCLDKFRVIDPGFGYRQGDELIVTPSNGLKTELVVDEFGHVTDVKVLVSGCGFIDIPDIKTNSTTGFNATFVPIFNVKNAIDEKDGSFIIPEGADVIEVVDCVGKVSPNQVFDVVPR